MLDEYTRIGHMQAADRGNAMRISPLFRILLLLIATGMLSCGCYAFIGRYGPSFYDGDQRQYFEKLIYRSRIEADSELTYRLAPDDALRVIGADSGHKAEALDAPLLLRFVWFSDVQLRQREVKLFSRKISRDLDDVISTFEHNFVQEDFDWAVYLSLIEATNRLHRDRPLDFMIHTGDGIDAGTIEELYQFIYISNQLTIPWLDVVGNHDIALFGNYRERLGYTRQAGVTFYPVGNLANFVWMHRKERVISGFGRHLLPTPAEGGHAPSEDVYPNKKLPPTFHHGFDLTLGCSCSAPPPRNLDYESVSGYYAVDLCATRIPIRLIVLNSVKSDEWGAEGRITPVQRGWLRNRLLPAGKGINLVFVHHRPAEFDRDTRALLLGPGHAPMVLFTGHTHQHHLLRYSGPQGGGYTELNNGSVLEYPQVGRLVELRGSPGQSVWLISRALWSSPMSLQNMPPEMEMAAALDACLAQRLEKRDILAEAVACGHYGAYDDYLKNKAHAWGNPQPFAEAWSAANVIVPIER